MCGSPASWVGQRGVTRSVSQEAAPCRLHPHPQPTKEVAAARSGVVGGTPRLTVHSADAEAGDRVGCGDVGRLEAAHAQDRGGGAHNALHPVDRLGRVCRRCG